MPNTAWRIMAHSSKHTLSTVAGFVLALQRSGKPEVPNLMIPLRRQLPQPISAASEYPLQNIHWATKQLSAYCDIRFFSTTGHIQESRHHDGWSLLLRPGTEHTSGSNQTVNSTENSYLCYKGFPWQSAATTRLWANQHSLDIITFITSYHLVGSP